MRKDGTPCRFDGCAKAQKNGGLCVGHYAQRMNGRQLAPLVGSPGYSARRFWGKVDKSGDCWLWTGRTINSGYGATSIDGQKWLTHRYSYTAEYGVINAGKVIDHICRNKLCVRPPHLREVDHIRNVRAQGLKTNNTSGVRGVSWDKARSQWTARVNFEGRKRYVGRFESLEDAAQAVAGVRADLYRTP